MSEEAVDSAEAPRFALTTKWLRRVYPWRGYRGTSVGVKIDRMSAADYAAVVAAGLNERLLDPDSDPVLVDRIAGTDWLDPDPVALGALASTGNGHRDPGADRLIAWVADTHGLPLAVQTLLQYKAFRRGGDRRSEHTPLQYGDFWWSSPAGQPEIVDLRNRLATASGEDYDAATATLLAVESSANATALAAFLVPTQHDVVERALAPEFLSVVNGELLIASVGNDDQLSRVLASATGAHLASGLTFNLAPFATIAARLGAPAAELIIAALEQTRGAGERAELLDVLSMCPTAEAFRVLVEHREIRGAHAALRSATARFPATALTELLTMASPFTLFEAEAFARSQPDTVAALLPTLDTGLANQLRNMSTEEDGLPEADPLPPMPGASKLSPWLVPQMLPRLVLRDGRHRLDHDRTSDVLRALGSGEGSGHVAVDALREHCDPASLAGWARALFRQYELADHPRKDRWVMALQGWVGDDDTVGHLAPKIRAWPGDGGNARALIGVDALGDIGTESALRELYRISQKVPFKALRTHAEKRVALIAAQLELTAEQLADRLLPDFGFGTTLPAAGLLTLPEQPVTATLTLDYGGRTFTVSLDDALRVKLTDVDGTALKALPRPTPDDDPERAAAAAKHFSAIKKQLRGFIADQAERLGRAMRHQRRLPATDFEVYYLGHPLMNVVARQLVWGFFDDVGYLRTSFAVGRGGSLADHLHQPVHLSANDLIGLVHPVQLDEYTRAAWRALAVQWHPAFPQLDRATDTLTDAERSSSQIERAAGRRVPTGALLGMTKTGWVRGAPGDAGVQSTVELRLPGGSTVVIHIDPGIPVGAAYEFPEQTITGVSISRGTFGDVEPILAAEILGDLEQLTFRR